MTREKAILFKDIMIKPIIDGEKTMTRRLVNQDICTLLESFKKIINAPLTGSVIPDGEIAVTGYWEDSLGQQRLSEVFIKPQYQVGDILYIKETHYRYGNWIKNGTSKKTENQLWRFIAREPDVMFPDNPPVKFYKSRVFHSHVECWYERNKLFMPKELARVRIKITGIKIERIQDISQEDAKAEGVVPCPHRPSSSPECPKQLFIQGFMEHH